jgi:hypothetical protein
VESLFQTGATVVAYGIGLSFVLVFFQVLDFGSSLLDMRGAHDVKLKGREARRRITEYVWSIPVTVTLGLVLALGVDLAGRFFFEDVNIQGGLIVMAVLVLIALSGGLGILFAIIRAETPSYAALRANLLEDIEERVSSAQIDAFRQQLSQIDEKQRYIRFGLRDRARMRRIRGELNGLADGFRARPPVGLAAYRAIRWRVVWAYLWRGNFLRVVNPVIATATFLLLLVSMVGLGAWELWWLLGLVLLGVIVTSGLALASARASLASKTAWHAVYLKQRSEVEDLLIELEKTSRKGVAGLGDRVTRALQILREQQE